MKTTEGPVEALSSLLKGELAAVETYQQALPLSRLALSAVRGGPQRAGGQGPGAGLGRQVTR